MDKLSRPRDQIMRIAKVVRKWSQKIYDKEFFPLEQRSRLWVDLQGFCAISSYVIFKELLSEFPKSKPLFCTDIDHAWVQAAGYTIDITARQFNRDAPEILIFKRKPKLIFHWIPDHTTSKLDGVYRTLKEWPGKHNPLIFFDYMCKYPSKEELYGQKI